MHISRRSVLGAVSLLRPNSLGGFARRVSWPGQSTAAVSLTYDDGYDSQLDHVGPALGERDYRATFFLTINNIRSRLSGWQAMAKAGHEIGDHSFSHPCALRDWTVHKYLNEEIAPAEEFLNANFMKEKRFFAYPCGFGLLGPGQPNAARERFLAAVRPHFLGARTVEGGLNDPSRVWRQRFLLNAYEPTYDADQIETAKKYLEGALWSGHWAILVFHDVLPKRLGEGDTSTDVHQRILDWISTKPLWCAPMGEVFRYLAPAEFSQSR